MQGYVVTAPVNDRFAFMVNGIRYTVVLTPTTLLINSLGKEVPRQYIAPSAKPVTVTGMRLGTTITAKTILIPGAKDGT